MINLLVVALLAAAPLPAKPAHYVTDNAGVLGAARAKALDDKLAQFERDTSDQILVYVDRDLPDGTTLEELSSEALHKWGVGQKGKDNGAILFVFTGARKMRIEVGYGLEGSLTDAKSKRITSTVMKPLLKDGDYADAVEQGADAIMKTVRGEAFTGTGKTAAEIPRASASQVSITPYLMVPMLGVFLLILVMTLRRRRKFSTSSSSGWTSSSSSDSSWSSSSSDSSSSSSSSDSFSSGGGDGGGGGASDSW